MEALQEHPLRLVKFINNSHCFNIHPLISVKELILQQKQLSYEKKMRFFCILANFKIKIAIKTAEIGLEYLDNRSRLMSKMEALKNTLYALSSSLTNSHCFNIHPLISVKELILQQKQLSYEKEDALFCILANFQDQNCNKNSRNWP